MYRYHGRVVIENLVKVFPEKNGLGVRAVNDISLSIEDREFMALVGPSGCGKSTALRMIAGLKEITSGTIDGRVVSNVLPQGPGYCDGLPEQRALPAHVGLR